MNKTSIQSKPASGIALPGSDLPLPPRPPRPPQPWPMRLLKSLASLRLTVILFALSIVLVFCGTLAQIDAGIWNVVTTYFRGWFVWIPFQLFFPRSLKIPGALPYPGGYVIGGALLVNLVAAHATRFKLSWKRSGIIVLHAGVIVMLVSELVTGLGAVEGNMAIVTGRSSNFLEHYDHPELVVVDPSGADSENVVVVPVSILREVGKGGVIRDERLPFDIEVVQYMPNSVQMEWGPPARNPATAGDGLTFSTKEEREGTGVDPDQKHDFPSAYVTFRKKGSDESLGTYLLSMWYTQMDWPAAQEVKVGGKTYEVGIRPRRSYKPYTIHLKEFRHDVYLGTTTAKNFSSTVQLADPARSEEREVRISMNNPLRYRGETFYQSGTLPADKGTILQVVRNPGWLMPYISCGLVCLGMLIHFGIRLVTFLDRRAGDQPFHRGPVIMVILRLVYFLTRRAAV